MDNIQHINASYCSTFQIVKNLRYITMQDEATAESCLQKLNRYNFKGRIISVEKAPGTIPDGIKYFSLGIRLPIVYE